MIDDGSEKLFHGSRADIEGTHVTLFVYAEPTGWSFRPFDQQEKKWLAPETWARSEAEGRELAESWALGSHNMTTQTGLTWRKT